MKRFLGLVVVLFIYSGVCFATNPVYDANMADSSGVVSDVNIPLDLKTYYIDYFSCQAVVSTEAYVGIRVTTTDISGVDNTVVSTVTYPTGYGVLLTSVTFTSWYGLVNNATYYIIPYSSGLAKLATTRALAVAGTAIDLPVISSGTGSFLLTPINIQASSPFSFRWQYSNDNTNWYNSTQSSVTIIGSTAPQNVLWDFGFTTYRYIRVSLLAGTQGSLKLILRGFGKKVSP
jgi:hypothetical protein